MTASEVRRSNAREIARTKGVPFARRPPSRGDVDRAKKRNSSVDGSSQRHLSGPDWYAEYMVAEQAGKQLPS